MSVMLAYACGTILIYILTSCTQLGLPTGSRSTVLCVLKNTFECHQNGQSYDGSRKLAIRREGYIELGSVESRIIQDVDRCWTEHILAIIKAKGCCVRGLGSRNGHPKIVSLE